MQLTEDEIKKWERIAKAKGWDTCPYILGGPMCRGCHNECIGMGYESTIWRSPKYGAYHRSCAIRRLQREEKRTAHLGCFVK